MIQIVYLIAGVILLPLLAAWVFTHLEYHIGRKALRIRLFGITLRRVSLLNIQRVSKRKPKFAENWVNTFKVSHRRLAIHRKSGLIRALVITPRHRYVFLKDLQAAINRCNSAAGEQPMDINEEEQEEMRVEEKDSQVN